MLEKVTELLDWVGWICIQIIALHGSNQIHPTVDFGKRLAGHGYTKSLKNSVSIICLIT